jgi:lipopolysaccharide transport system ATP-binding protein
MRLAFAVAVHTQPQVLLVDEFLSVGDLSFQSKCLERIAQLKDQGCAIIYISHSVEQVQELCDQVLWLRKGQVVAQGEPEVVVGQYLAEMRSETQQRTPSRPPQLTKTGVELRVNENRFGSLEVEITNVRLLPASKLHSGDALSIEIEYLSPQLIHAPNFGVSISDEDGEVCFDTNISAGELALSSIQGQGKIALHLDRLDLSGGQYFVDVGIYETHWDYAYDYHWHAYPLVIDSMIQKKGLLCPPHRWEISKAQMITLRRL